jgi:hypothetical protein
MADSYFVSNPTNHLAKIADDTRKSALDVYAQRLRDAAKKSQQFQQDRFKMGQINRTGHLKLADTLAGKGYAAPLNNMSSLQQYMQQVAPDMRLGRLADRYGVIGEGAKQFANAGIFPNLTPGMTAFGVPGASIREGIPVSVQSAKASVPAQAKVDEGTEVTEKEHMVGGKPTGSVERTTKHSRKEQRKLKGNNIDTVARRLGINLNEGETKTIRGTTYSQGQYIPKAGGYLIILPNGTTMFVDENGNTIQRSK